jgi:hypothetical protein
MSNKLEPPPPAALDDRQAISDWLECVHFGTVDRL